MGLHPLPGSMDRSPSSETNHGNVLFGHDNYCDLSVKREKRGTLPNSTYRKNKFCADKQRVQVGKHMRSPLHSIHESPVRLRGVLFQAAHTKLHGSRQNLSSQAQRTLRFGAAHLARHPIKAFFPQAPVYRRPFTGARLQVPATPPTRSLFLSPHVF